MRVLRRLTKWSLISEHHSEDLYTKKNFMGTTAKIMQSFPFGFRCWLRGSVVGLPLLFLLGCAAGPDDPGVEYAPQMYHSIPYEGLSQIKDKEAGRWLSSTNQDGHAEYYNSNPYNPFGMTMREPPEGVVKRGDEGLARISADSIGLPRNIPVTPLDTTAAVLEDGKVLYGRFCVHCHGKQGYGDGKVGKVFLGVTAYASSAVIDKPEGYIFNVITYGKGRMGSHASQISADDRWRISRYVKYLQQVSE